MAKNIKLKKYGVKHVLLTIILPVALVGVVYTKYIRYIQPKEDINDKYENISTYKINANSRVDILKVVESLPRFKAKNNVVIDSKFRPINQYLSKEQIVLLRNYIVFNTLYMIDKSVNLDDNFSYDYINVVNELQSIQVGSYKDHNLFLSLLPKDIYQLSDSFLYRTSLSNGKNLLVKINTSTYNNLVLASNYVNIERYNLFCSMYEQDGDNLVFSNCIDEYEYANNYFNSLYSNLNNVPSMVNLDTRLKVFYLLANSYYLKDDSACYYAPSMDMYMQNYNDCIEDLNAARIKLVNVGYSNGSGIFNYLDFTNMLSFSLKIPYDSINNSNGFYNEFKFKEAKRMIARTYGFDQVLDRYMIESEINKVWDKNDPDRIFNLSNYGMVFEKEKNRREQAAFRKEVAEENRIREERKNNQN